jgi:hypothetical protein
VFARFLPWIAAVLLLASAQPQVQASTPGRLRAVAAKVAAARAAGWKRAWPVLRSKHGGYDKERRGWSWRFGPGGTREVFVQDRVRDLLLGRGLVRRAGLTPSAVEFRSAFQGFFRGIGLRCDRVVGLETVDEMASAYALPDPVRAFVLALTAQYAMDAGVTFRRVRLPSSAIQIRIAFDVSGYRVNASRNFIRHFNLRQAKNALHISFVERTGMTWPRGLSMWIAHTDAETELRAYRTQQPVLQREVLQPGTTGHAAAGDTVAGALPPITPSRSDSQWVVQVEWQPEGTDWLRENHTPLAHAIRAAPHRIGINAETFSCLMPRDW